MVRLRENEHEDVPGVEGVEGVPPVSDARTFATVAASAPKDATMLTIESTWLGVRAAACAKGASESIDVAIASPVATAATFATAFVVTVCITIVNYFKRT